MKALSVMQPWATLILEHGKLVENRTWRSGYLGPLVIVSSARMEPGWDQEHWDDALCDAYPDHDDAIQAHGAIKVLGEQVRFPKCCPLALALGTVDVVGYDRDRKTLWDAEDQWHWRLANPRKFKTPFHVRGRLGLYEIPDPTIELALTGVLL